MDLKSTIKDRDLNAYDVLIATLLAEFWNYGFINQGTLNIITKKIADSLLEYFTIKHGEFESKAGFNLELIQKTLDLFINELNPYPMPEIVEIEENKKYEIRIESSKCRFCPKGVGKAEIPGTLCMFPGLIRNLIQDRTEKEKIISSNVSKKENKCVFLVEKESTN